MILGITAETREGTYHMAYNNMFLDFIMIT